MNIDKLREKIIVESRSICELAIREWANTHPEPDNPLIIQGVNTYSANDIIEMVESGTGAGNSYLNSLMILCLESTIKKLREKDGN